MASVQGQKEQTMPSDDNKHKVDETWKLREALQMLFDLLEEYAPSWYTKEHHDKADAALRFVGR